MHCWCAAATPMRPMTVAMTLSSLWLVLRSTMCAIGSLVAQRLALEWWAHVVRNWERLAWPVTLFEWERFCLDPIRLPQPVVRVSVIVVVELVVGRLVPVPLLLALMVVIVLIVELKPAVFVVHLLLTGLFRWYSHCLLLIVAELDAVAAVVVAAVAALAVELVTVVIWPLCRSTKNELRIELEGRHLESNSLTFGFGVLLETIGGGCGSTGSGLSSTALLANSLLVQTCFISCRTCSSTPSSKNASRTPAMTSSMTVL